jgi:DNA-binding NarL/FixJ family response regulator
MKRILIVDDHPVLREGIVHVLQAEKDLEVCGQAGSVSEAIRMVEATKPDLVLTDLTLPGRSGIELIKDLKTLAPQLPILVMSMHDEMIYAERVLRAGGRGYLMKETAADLLIDAIHKVLKGGIFASPAVTNHFLDSLSMGERNRTASFPLKRLTDRELEVFEKIGNGENTQRIAEQLSISPRTVDAHRSHIREKLGLGDSSTLTLYAVRWIESGSLE